MEDHACIQKRERMLLLWNDFLNIFTSVTLGASAALLLTSRGHHKDFAGFPSYVGPGGH